MKFSLPENQNISQDRLLCIYDNVQQFEKFYNLKQGVNSFVASIETFCYSG